MLVLAATDYRVFQPPSSLASFIACVGQSETVAGFDSNFPVRQTAAQDAVVRGAGSVPWRLVQFARSPRRLEYSPRLAKRSKTGSL